MFDVFAAFERQKELYAVIVTENGAPEEKALLVLTPSDFPAINRCLEAYSAKNILSGCTFCLRARIGWSVRGKRPY